MPTTAITLYRDTYNFFRNHLIQLLLIVFFTAIVATVLGHIFAPSDDTLKSLQKLLQSKSDMSTVKSILALPIEQQNRLLHFFITKALVTLFTHTLLLATILTLLQKVNQGENPSVLQTIKYAFHYFPRLLLLLLMTTVFIEVGYLFFILPGLLLLIAFSLSPMICVQEQCSAISAMRISAGLAFKRLSLILPALLAWGILQLMVMLLIKHLALLPTHFFILLSYMLVNTLSALLIIYLFRLYMLILDEQA